jgi:hypothetical protein
VEESAEEEKAQSKKEEKGEEMSKGSKRVAALQCTTALLQPTYLIKEEP